VKTISATGNKPSQSGFTLVEIIVSLTIIAIMVGVMIPSIEGVIRENQAQEPLREVVAMVREARTRAIRTQRPFQIGFDAQGCYASAYYRPYTNLGEYEQLKQEQEARSIEKELLEAAEARFGAVAPDPLERYAPDDEYLVRYEWPENMKVQVKFWGDSEWQPLSGAQNFRWVFQPSGMCRPLTIQLENDGVFLEARFNPLTAEIEDLTSYVE